MTDPVAVSSAAASRVTLFFLLAICAIAVVHALWLYAPCDDAYIFLVYVKNLLSGHGLTYNGARVEGFTSVTWVALLSLLGMTGVALPRLAESTSLICGLASLVATFWVGRRAGLAPSFALLPVAMLAASGDFAFYMGVGLETALFTALVVGCTGFALSAPSDPSGDGARDARSTVVFPLSLAVLVLTRPDGALVAGVLLLTLWATRGSPLPSLRSGLVLSAFLAPVLVTKRIYYGYWLPNTYYAKAGAGLANVEMGLRYLEAMATRHAALLLVLLGASAAAILLRHSRTADLSKSSLAPLAVVPATWLAYVILVGGDNMVGARSVVPVLPLVLVLLVRLAAWLPFGYVASASAIVALTLAVGFATNSQVTRHRHRWIHDFEPRRAAGLLLRERFSPDTLVALGSAGIIPFHSELPTIDMLGLNDVHIAHHGHRDRTIGYGHQAGDGAYVLAREPGVIVFGSGFKPTADRKVSSSEIWASSEFHDRYVREQWPGIGYAFVRHDLEAAAPVIMGGRTNVLLVLIDTLRADHLGAWGYEVDTSPRLDELARRGVRFQHFFSNSPWTRPSVASILTGKYPRSTGIYEEKFDALAQNVTTLAERLQPRGYRNLGVTANPSINAWFGFDQGFDEYLDSESVWHWMRTDAAASVHEKADLGNAQITTNRALELLEHHAEANDASPFYLQVLYIDPHRPYLAPSEFVDLLPSGPHLGYDAEIRFTDAEIGRLLDTMERRGWMNDTLVIVTSDHGEGLDDHPGLPFSERHGHWLYDSVLSVPMILAHPALQPRVVTSLASSVDLVPTLMDLLGWPLPEGEVPGYSLASLVLNGSLPPNLPTTVIAETDWRNASKVSIRSLTHRYVRSDDALRFQREGIFEGRKLNQKDHAFLGLPPFEFYRIEAGRPEHPDHSRSTELLDGVAEKLTERLASWEESTPARPPLGRSPDDVDTLADGSVVPAAPSTTVEEPSFDVIEELRSLGYLEEDD